MHSHLRKIGNSGGIRIANTFLETCAIGDEVNLRIASKSLIIKALKAPSSGWFEHYQTEAEVDVFASLVSDDFDDEWQW